MDRLTTQSTFSPFRGALWASLGGLLLFATLFGPSGCVVGGQTCTTQADCPNHLICNQGTCQNCSADLPCTAPLRCFSGQCWTPGTNPDGGSNEPINAPDKPSASEPPTGKEPPTEANNQEPTAPEQDAGSPELPSGCPAGATQACYPFPTETEGKGVCKSGVQTCQADGTWSDCQNAVGPSQETCGDGLDNDCDGQTDEPDAGCQCKAGDTKPCGETTGACQAGTITCRQDSTWGECKGAVGPSAEICDGKDNNCNGQIDENHPDKGKSCSAGTGTCKTTGKNVCSPDGSVVLCNASPGKPSAEVCDGKDNNCDGQIDENLTRSCYSGPKGTQDVGECKAGTQTCNNGAWSKCTGEIKPASNDACDGKDNDCDGDTDEGCKCVRGKTQKCGSSIGECVQGTQTCGITGQWGACKGGVTPTAELCDGKDNDCDGSIDENFSNKGKSCTVGKGACQRTGTYICNSAQSGTTCNAKAGLASKETCNNKDDDCDGLIDESLARSCYTGKTGTKGVGVCKGGSQTCKAGVWSTCSGQVTPTTEKCDGKDNDCDGSTDETWKLGLKCSVGKGACSRIGSTICNKTQSGTQCSAVAGSPSPELCDGIDNDCDGSIDETYTNKGKSCTVGKGICVRTGTYICKKDKSGTTCNATPGTPVTETCDGKDNDCDGLTDEGTFGPCRINGCNSFYRCVKGKKVCLEGPGCCGSNGKICP